jgi:hypothetical protein
VTELTTKAGRAWAKRFGLTPSLRPIKTNEKEKRDGK